MNFTFRLVRITIEPTEADIRKQASGSAQAIANRIKGVTRMVKLYDSGVYLLNGKTLVREKDAELSLNKEEAKKARLLMAFCKRTIPAATRKI